MSNVTSKKLIIFFIKSIDKNEKCKYNVNEITYYKKYNK